MLDGLAISRHAFARTVRLITTARLREAVLLALAAPDELDALAEIEGATSTRLMAQERGTEHMGPREFIHGVPYASFINAAFAYAKPRSLNRFNGPGRGAWYAALTTQTCVAEVTFHITAFLADAGTFKAVVDYAELFASLAGEYVDLRETPEHPGLHPDGAMAYPIGNALADAARARGLNGIIYPSVRHPGGTCFAALWPHAVQSVAPGECVRLIWSGSPAPTVTVGVC